MCWAIKPFDGEWQKVTKEEALKFMGNWDKEIVSVKYFFRTGPYTYLATSWEDLDKLIDKYGEGEVWLATNS